jgi:predicted DNA-binding transcriptional regulator AlpA
MMSMQFPRPSLPRVESGAPLRQRSTGLRDVIRICALSRSTIYRRVADGTFPPPVQLGPRASAWRADALQAWTENPAGYRVAGRSSEGELCSQNARELIRK